MIEVNRENYYLGSLKNCESHNNKEDWITLDDLLNIDNTIWAYYMYENVFINLLLRLNHKNKKFKWLSGDIVAPVDEFTIVKNRCNDLHKGVIIRSLDFDRHWGNYYCKPKDIPFEDKIGKVFWRGATTGTQSSSGGNRFDLVLNWCNKNENIDVGFSQICQYGIHWGKFFHDFYYFNSSEWVSEYLKGPCDIQGFLQYKYLLSVRGNDKDTGLNWKLNSNSLVIMPKPTVCSWLMETMLQPNIHYVEVKDDFSDLEEKLNWCNDNQQKCKEIIFNANSFMEVFKDSNKEKELEEKIINLYFELTKQ